MSVFGTLPSLFDCYWCNEVCWLGFHRQPQADMPGSLRHEHGIQNQTVQKNKKGNGRKERETEEKAGTDVIQHVGWHYNVTLQEPTDVTLFLWYILRRSLTSASPNSQPVTTLYSNSTPKFQSNKNIWKA